MPKYILIIFISMLYFSSILSAKTLKVALSSNVAFVMKDLIKEFNKQYPSIKIKIIIASSGKLTALIKNNAPYDIFMSADMLYPELLYNQNLTINKPSVYARGLLIIFSKTKGLVKNDISFISNKNIRKIAIANPKTAPYGQATMQVLKNKELFKINKHKFIYGQNISHALSYAFNSVQIAFIAKASLYLPTLKEFNKDAYWKDINPTLYKPIKQGIVVLKNTKHKQEALLFNDFILSKKAQSLFSKSGYLLP